MVKPNIFGFHIPKVFGYEIPKMRGLWSNPTPLGNKHPSTLGNHFGYSPTLGISYPKCMGFGQSLGICHQQNLLVVTPIIKNWYQTDNT